MKSSSQVTGLPLVGLKEGLECGTVKDIVADPQTKKIKSLIILGSKSDYDFHELKIADIIGIGKDYVITQSIENAIAINLADAGMSLLKIRCIASSGDVLGHIVDFTFNEKTGEIQSLQIDSGNDIPGDSMITLSNNLLFVNLEADQSSSAASSLEKEQQDYMLGRVVKNDIKDQSGQIVIEKGTTVTADVIRIAEEAGVMIDLTLEL